MIPDQLLSVTHGQAELGSVFVLSVLGAGLSDAESQSGVSLYLKRCSDRDCDRYHSIYAGSPQR